MSLGPAIAVLALGAVLLTLMGLTSAGERRRGGGLGVTVAAGIFFPITWVVWHLRDEQSFRAGRRV